MKSVYYVLVAFLIIILPVSLIGQISSANFTHFDIENPFLPNNWGIGSLTLYDYDGDGDLDITAHRQGNGEVYWFEYQNDSTWVKHLIGSEIKNQLGAAVYDLNKDGHADLIMGRIWLQNPANLRIHPDGLWEKHLYNGGMDAENHDVMAVDIDNDGNKDIVCYSQNYGGGTLRWYNAVDPLNWKVFTIDSLMSEREKPAHNMGIHAGFAPNGIGDLNNDGFNDIIMPTGWYENPKSDASGKWVLHRWKEYNLDLGIKWTLYGTAFRSWIVDIDNDGDNDVFLTDCDVALSKGFWLENVEYAKNFLLHQMPFESEESGNLHSLGVVDIDNDDDMDVFSGEEESPNNRIFGADTAYIKPAGLKERGFFWENVGNKSKPEFEFRVIHRDNPGWHNTIFGDVDGDGDMDMVTKIWSADEGIWHIDYWRNDINKK